MFSGAVRNTGSGTMPRSASQRAVFLRPDRVACRGFGAAVCWCRTAAVLLAGCALLFGCSLSRNAANARSEESIRLAQQAYQAEDRGDKQSAEILLTKAVNKSPDNCETRLELSELLLQHGSMEAAVKHLRQLVAQNPDDPRGYVRLAQALYQQKHYNDADKILAHAMELDPGHPQGLMLRGRLEEELRRNDERALEIYYRALLSGPTQSEAQLRIAAIHLRNGRPQQASPLLRSALESSRSCPLEKTEASWLLGTSYAQEKRWADARAAMDTAVQLRIMTSDDWYQVAYVRHQDGDLAAAKQALNSSLKMSPQHREALTMRSYLDNSANTPTEMAKTSSPR